jgi:Transposase IS4
MPDHEMYHFLGITPRISQSPVDSGDYEAYFSPRNKVVHSLEIPTSDGFARHYMKLIRYMQIRAAFRPEDRSSQHETDKSCQLRHAINTLNQAASNAKFIGENVTFDDGGIGSRHEMNPVMQYNKDKPQKFRVDLDTVSSILSMEIAKIERQVGSKKETFTCPLIGTKYQKDMPGVDKSGQMRAAGGSFAAKARYHKWYKRAYFAVLDMMVINALIIWNLSARDPTRRTSERLTLKRIEFVMYISQSMLNFKETVVAPTNQPEG